MKSLEIRKLGFIEIISVYNKHLRNDFPREERRPLPMVLLGTVKGYYECLGLFEEKDIRGYFFLVKNNNDYLVDYFAIINGYRNSGLGSAFMNMVMEYYDSADSVILEIENPDYAGSEEERALRIKRLNFYRNNEFMDTGVRTVTFGVDFMILQYKNLIREQAEVKRMYDLLYRQTLGDKLFNSNIKIY